MTNGQPEGYRNQAGIPQILYVGDELVAVHCSDGTVACDSTEVVVVESIVGKRVYGTSVLWNPVTGEVDA